MNIWCRPYFIYSLDFMISLLADQPSPKPHRFETMTNPVPEMIKLFTVIMTPAMTFLTAMTVNMLPRLTINQ